MIRSLAGIIVRALVEVGLVLFVFAAIFVVFAYRIARRFATTTPDALDRLAGPLAAGLALVGGRSRRAAELYDELYDDDEIDEPDDGEREPPEKGRIGHDEWRDLVP